MAASSSCSSYKDDYVTNEDDKKATEQNIAANQQVNEVENTKTQNLEDEDSSSSEGEEEDSGDDDADADAEEEEEKKTNVTNEDEIVVVEQKIANEVKESRENEKTQNLEDEDSSSSEGEEEDSEDEDESSQDEDQADGNNKISTGGGGDSEQVVAVVNMKTTIANEVEEEEDDQESEQEEENKAIGEAEDEDDSSNSEGEEADSDSVDDDREKDFEDDDGKKKSSSGGGGGDSEHIIAVANMKKTIANEEEEDDQESNQEEGEKAIGDEEDSEDDVAENKSNGNISASVATSTRPKSKKRLFNNNADVGDAKDHCNKRQKNELDVAGQPKSRSKKVWKDEDEMVLLREMINYKRNQGEKVPSSEYEILFQSVRCSFSHCYTLNQVKNKVDTFAKKYRKQSIIKGSHDIEVHKLLKAYYEDENEGDKPNEANYKVHQQSSRKRKVLLENSECSYDYLELSRNVVHGYWTPIPNPPPGLVDVIAKKGWETIGKGNAQDLNKKWKDLTIAEGKVHMQRLQLIIEQQKLMLDAIGRKN